MATREELLKHLWRYVINANMDSTALHSTIERSQLGPKDPFADTGPALQRLFDLGAQPSDLCLIRRDAAYGAVFGTLYAIGDPGVEDDNVFMLFEELLMADPSGLEGRPGSGSSA